MRPWALLALPFPLVVYALDKLHGVSPLLAGKYVETAGQWTCLDGSKKIPWSAVNDDYCDCPDGSDEPGACHWCPPMVVNEVDQIAGTGACPSFTFYCINEGHIGASIQSTHVNDGLCGEHTCRGMHFDV